jgi:hypothetical protein
MDLALEWQDNMYFDALYTKLSPDWLGADRSNWVRQFISIYMTVAVGGALLYFSLSGLNWFVLFDKSFLKHVRPLKMHSLFILDVVYIYFS